MSNSLEAQKNDATDQDRDFRIDRRAALQGGGLLVTAAAASSVFAPAVKASTQAKAILSTSDPIISDVVLDGSEFTLTGANLGNQLGDACCVFKDPMGKIALARATSVSPNQVIGTIVAIPPSMVEGRAMLMLGVGTDAIPASVPAGYAVTEPTLVWTTEEEIAATSPQTVSLAGALKANRAKLAVTNHWGTIMNGQVVVDISSSGPDCRPGDQIKFVSDMQLSNGEWLRFDLQGPLDVSTQRRLDLCASDYCEFVKDAINQFTNGDLELICTTQGTFPTVQFVMQSVADHRSTPPIFHTFVAGSALIQIRT